MMIMRIASGLRILLPVLLIAFVALAAFQPGFADDQDIEQLRKAAEQGDAAAQYNLGVMYKKGAGVPEDDSEAVKWCRRAAKQGLAAAQHGLGVMYEKGAGVPENYAEALKWYRKAAEQGYTSAQLRFGIMYALGRGIPENYVYAYAWVSLAVAQGDKEAVEAKDLLRPKMTSEQVAKAQELAADLWERIESSRSD